jgi:hypothetical protein
MAQDSIHVAREDIMYIEFEREFAARMAQDSIHVAREDIMYIEFERSGGFAGGRVTFSLNSDTLPQEEAEQLRQLVDSAAFFQLPALIADTAAVPDEFVYVVTVESGDLQHTVKARESSVPQDLHPLIDWLSRRARRTRGGGGG